MKTLARTDLETVHGGMRWQHLRESLNVEDRRPGAPPLWKQRQDTIRRNQAKGYPE